MKILAAATAMIFFAVGATAETTNDLSDAEIQGRQLVQQLNDARPTTNFTQTGVLKIRDAKGGQTNIPIKFETFIRSNSWINVCQASWKNGLVEQFDIVHNDNLPNTYINDSISSIFANLSDSEKNSLFANSDFWICDLGLEFFHWPEQKILKKEVKRSRGCSVLESTNPNPSTNGYSRVVSWIDEESGGIVHAEAFDTQNKLLKEFDPKSFKKVNGQWQLQEMEIRNVQTGSRTRLEFDLNKQ